MQDDDCTEETQSVERALEAASVTILRLTATLDQLTAAVEDLAATIIGAEEVSTGALPPADMHTLSDETHVLQQLPTDGAVTHIYNAGADGRMTRRCPGREGTLSRPRFALFAKQMAAVEAEIVAAHEAALRDQAADDVVRLLEARTGWRSLRPAEARLLVARTQAQLRRQYETLERARHLYNDAQVRMGRSKRLCCALLVQ
jgi:hypothetical protein